MSTTTLKREFRVGGVLTAATSMTSTVTYGGGTPVADTEGNPSTGIYTFEITDPALDLTYEFTITTIYAGVTYTDVITKAGTTSTTGYTEFSVDDVVTYVKTALGGSPSDATALAHVKAGQRNVLDALDTRCTPPRRHNWSFLQPEVTMTFSATVTGTAVTQGTYSTTTGFTTLTATSASFDDSMLGHNLTFDTSGTAYEIKAVTSTTVIVLSGDASAETTGDTFSVDAKGYHDTPTGFRGIKVPPVFAYSGGTRYPMIQQSPHQIRLRWQQRNPVGYTRYWALEPKTFDASAGQAYRILVAPVPIEDMVASMQILMRVPDPAAGKYFPGGDLVSTAIRDAALADVEKIAGATQGTWTAMAQASLWSAIDADKSLIAATNGPEQLRES